MSFCHYWWEGMRMMSLVLSLVSKIRTRFVPEAVVSADSCFLPPPGPGPGPGPTPQHQLLVVSDRSPALAAPSLHSVALNYGTLPRAPRRALPPSSSTTSLPRTRTGPAPPLGPQSIYATLAHPRRSASSTNGHYRQLPDEVVRGADVAPPPPRLSGNAPAQPLRLDVPPESDWRREADYRTLQPRSARQRPLQRPLRGLQLCSLCQQLPAESARPYCSSCGTYVARFRPTRT